jgi:hypothetical protein
MEKILHHKAYRKWSDVFVGLPYKKCAVERILLKAAKLPTGVCGNVDFFVFF